ncbi:hypothetical protein HSISB1_100 [Streptococcus sp. HSISB1]|nr:hypothetical protein HSISB1_100 [Streptococcus sp. HSISB1]
MAMTIAILKMTNVIFRKHEKSLEQFIPDFLFILNYPQFPFE